MNQGCPHEGTDHRLLGRLTCWLQRHFTFRSRIPPPQLRLDFLGLGLYLPIGRNRLFLLRIHLFRYDYYSNQYIFFSAAAKRLLATDAA